MLSRFLKYFLILIIIVSCAPKTPQIIPRAVLFGNPEKSEAQISPDGKRLAFIAPHNGVLNIWIRTIGHADDQVVTEAGRAVLHREGQLRVEVFEFVGDPLAGVLGQQVEGHGHDLLAAGMGCAQQLGDGIDGGVLVIGFDDDVEHLVPAVECLLEGIGDLAAGCGPVVVGHADEPRTLPTGRAV